MWFISRLVYLESRWKKKRTESGKLDGKILARPLITAAEKGLYSRMLRWLNLLITFNDYYRKTNKQMNKQKNSLTQTGSASVFRLGMRYLSPENKSFRVYLVSLRRIDIWRTYIEVCCVHYFGYNGLLVTPWPTLSDWGILINFTYCTRMPSYY